VNRKRKFKRNNTEVRKKYKTFNIEDILDDNDTLISESPFSESSIIEYKIKLRKRKYNHINKSNTGINLSIEMKLRKIMFSWPSI